MKTHENGAPAHGLRGLEILGTVVQEEAASSTICRHTGDLHRRCKTPRVVLRNIADLRCHCPGRCGYHTQKKVSNSKPLEASCRMLLARSREDPTWMWHGFQQFSQLRVWLDVFQGNVMHPQQELRNSRLLQQALFNEPTQCSAVLLVQFIGLAVRQPQDLHAKGIDLLGEQLRCLPVVLVEAIVEIEENACYRCRLCSC
mmetsp:Transcript_51097/g.141517  ORF Transcript_51097/g.141517 Transcript_51097/m.141517 type:complete len:200 (-) Transcript_51097:2-601(-)